MVTKCKHCDRAVCIASKSTMLDIGIEALVRARIECSLFRIAQAADRIAEAVEGG